MPVKPLLDEPIPPSSLRVVCDTMLQGLCKKLRMCGVDAVALENGQRHEDCVSIAAAATSELEGPRYVISKGGPALQLAKLVPAGHCLAIRSELLGEQIEEVFRYFNVVATGGDLFSRCVMCNNARYLMLSGPTLLSLHDLHVSRTASSAAAAVSRLTISQQQQPVYGVDEDDETDELDYYDLGMDNGGDCSEEEELDQVMQIRPRWHEVEGGRIDMNTGLMDNRVAVDVGSVPRTVIEKTWDFWICANCGKVYWQGSHWERAQDKVKTVLNMAADPLPPYQPENK